MIKRPKDPNPLFKMEDEKVIVKSLSPLQRQREKDGTPITRGNPTSLLPPDTELYLEGLNKGSEENVEKAAPLDAEAVIKAYLEHSEGE